MITTVKVIYVCTPYCFKLHVGDPSGLGQRETPIPPLLFSQVRIGGCKGMLAVWPDKVMARVSGKPGCMMAVRPSLQKFPSNRNDLEASQAEQLQQQSL